MPAPPCVLTWWVTSSTWASVTCPVFASPGVVYLVYRHCKDLITLVVALHRRFAPARRLLPPGWLSRRRLARRARSRASDNFLFSCEVRLCTCRSGLSCRALVYVLFFGYACEHPNGMTSWCVLWPMPLSSILHVGAARRHVEITHCSHGLRVLVVAR